jgi:hypothetical protein
VRWHPGHGIAGYVRPNSGNSWQENCDTQFDESASFVVDDDSGVLRLVVATLQSAGYKILEATWDEKD